MKQQFKLTVTPRAQTGRSASRRLRKANRVPAILYGKHTSPESLSIDGAEFIRLLKGVAGRAVLVELERTDKTDKALSFFQEVQRDPITDKYLHVDLQEVKADEKFEIRVAVRVTGESFGVKNQSGVLELNMQHLRVRCFPKDLPEAVNVDVTELKVGETIKVSSLKPVV
ncbi:MAG: 50S ribosomal protein L25, partial [Pedosphaera sp.]|nr:50S ribosomal protein L25 [Pedosphaera sp.]